MSINGQIVRVIVECGMSEVGPASPSRASNRIEDTEYHRFLRDICPVEISIVYDVVLGVGPLQRVASRYGQGQAFLLGLIQLCKMTVIPRISRSEVDVVDGSSLGDQVCALFGDVDAEVNLVQLMRKMDPGGSRGGRSS
jgi:hypothetical protein